MTLVNPEGPTSLAADNKGSLYIGDNAWAVHKLVLATSVMTTVAGDGTYGYTGDGGFATNAELSNVYGVAVDTAGNLYIGDRANRVVRRVSASGYIYTYVGTGACANNGDGGLANAASVCTPEQVIVDPTGQYLYVADLSYGQVRRVNLTTGVITTFAGGGTSLADGVAATTELLTPDSLAVDSAGNLYIGDHNHAKIRKVTLSTGLISTLTGNGTDADSGDGGQASQATITSPLALAVSPTGSVYFADNTAVRRIDATTGVITTVTGVSCELGMAFDSTGTLYTSDAHSVYKVTGIS